MQSEQSKGLGLGVRNKLLEASQPPLASGTADEDYVSIWCFPSQELDL
jgi:hypothetical protein